jgi:radical SAM protein with 4Fe4S-binding SPASM domain
LVYTTVQPDRAPGTIEYYRIGNVLDEPVIDEQALARVSTIRTDQLRAPDGFDCATCFARVACLGGCHCQYVGQDGVDPRNRFDIARAIQRTCRGGPPWPPMP